MPDRLSVLTSWPLAPPETSPLALPLRPAAAKSLCGPRLPYTRMACSFVGRPATLNSRRPSARALPAEVWGRPALWGLHFPALGTARCFLVFFIASLLSRCVTARTIIGSLERFLFSPTIKPSSVSRRSAGRSPSRWIGRTSPPAACSDEALSQAPDRS
jgi:hypothetical protein